MRESLHDPDRVTGADICDFEVFCFGGDGWVQHVLEAVEPKPVLEDEAGRVLIAAIEHVVVIFLGRHFRCLPSVFCIIPQDWTNCVRSKVDVICQDATAKTLLPIETCQQKAASKECRA